MVPSTREIAILIWLAVGIGFCMIKPDVRTSLASVLRAFGNWRIQLVFWMLAVYTALVAWGSAWAGLWDLGQLKNTIIWFIAVGFATLMRLPNLREGSKFFREWVSDNLKLIVVVEFLVTFYTFDLIVELLLQPVVFVLGAMKILADRDPKHEKVAKLLDGVFVAAGLAIIAYATYMIVADFSNFATLGTVGDFYTPILLSFASLPFFFALHVFMTYERVFSVLRFSIKDEQLRKRAKREIVLGFGPRPALVERWNRYVGAHRPTTIADLRRSIRDVKNARRREAKPIEVPAANGWSPDAARHFLEGQGIVTRDYHRLYDEWMASSPYLEIGTAILPNNIAYYIDGDELVASRLKIVLNVNAPDEAEHAEAEFLKKCLALSAAAIPGRDITVAPEPFAMDIHPWRISMTRRDWSGGIRNGYELEFTVEVPSARVALGQRSAATEQVA